LSAATQSFYKLEKLLTNKRVLKDVAKLSPHHQTSSLEAFHVVILCFAGGKTKESLFTKYFWEM
jgi:hypothetical protein